MNTTDVLPSSIRPQRQIETATDLHPAVTIDDTNYTMEDYRAFMGGPTVNSAENPLRSKINDTPRPMIKSNEF
jgi:hypothetical protein